MLFETYSTALPPLPPQELTPRKTLFPFVGDEHLPYILPAFLYWVIGLTFHFVDSKGYLQNYKLHTPAELLRKNRASQWDVIKFALLQQLAQFFHGYWMADSSKVYPSEAYCLAEWARQIRWLEIFAAHMLQNVGLAGLISTKQAGLVTPAVLAQPFSGAGSSVHPNGSWSEFASGSCRPPAFSDGEILAARLLHWYLYPLFQYALAIALADTWQYFTHRVYHANRWLYKHIHSLHHDVYVPFAYGAFYNHPLETIPVDVIGFPICLGLAGLDDRQAAFFGCLWTYKTVVDHCGYDLPWNPSNLICDHSVLFHDLHHQSWGLKYNFSNYSSFWDLVCGTYQSGCSPEALERYAKGRKEKKAATGDAASSLRPVAGTGDGSSTAIEY